MELTLEQKRAIAMARARQRMAEAQAAPPAPTGAEAMRAKGLSSPDPAGANAAADPRYAPGERLQEQFGIGANTGVAGLLGAPSDLASMGINALGGDVSLPGGSEFWEGFGKKHGYIKDEPAQTRAERLSRTTGEYVGPGALVAPVAGVTTLGGMGLNTAADTAAGLAAGGVREADGGPVAEIAAALLAGGGVVSGAKALRPGHKAPTLPDLRAKKDAAYAKVDADPSRLSAAETDALKQRVVDAMIKARMNPLRHPKAASMVDEILDMPAPTVTEIDQLRQVVGRDVAGAMDGSEARLGGKIKDEIDAFLDELTPGSIPEETVGALKSGRELNQKVKKSETLDTAIYKAGNRAATSGSGGNEINTTRQNIARILENPRKYGKFTGTEIDKMQEIVDGTRLANAARAVGGMSPTTGKLQAGAAGLLTGASYLGMNPLIMAPSGIGFVAKALGEHLTNKQVKNLSEIIRNGGPVATKNLSDGERAVLRALLASTAAQHTQAVPQP